MQELNIFERLANTNPSGEIWWDSSPLVYENWANKTIASYSGTDQKIVQTQLSRMFNPDAPAETFFRGCTTNPPLSLAVFNDNPSFWDGVVKDILAKNPGIDKERLFWLTYKEIVRKGAKRMQPLYEKTNGKNGYLSGQVDPRSCYDYDAMLKQALEISEIAPNVMVKVPGTKEGYRLLKELTSRGISTNNTLSFVLPQFMAAADAVKEGLEIAKKNNVDTSKWRSVITAMCARYGKLGDLEKEAAEKGVALTESDIRWAELAIFKKAYKIIKERGYPSKMLICSMRVSPGDDTVWHLEKVAGSDIVYTCPPSFIAEVMKKCDHIKFDPKAIDEKPPAEVMDKLMKIPYFSRGYDEKGYTHDEFNSHAALLSTAKEFSNATQKMVDFVAKNL